MNVTVNGAPFSLDLAGQGEPILFVHGFPLNRHMWRAQLEAFAGSNQVIAPDLRGFGGSGPSLPVATMDQYADDLAALLDELKIAAPVTLCGLSMGGYAAFGFVRRHRAGVARLILCDTKAAADTPEKREDRERMAEEVLHNGTINLVKEMPAGLFAKRTLVARPAVLAAVVKMIATAPPAAIAAALRGMAMRPDSSDLLPQIDVPTLVLCGEEDSICPPDEMRSMAAQISGATFVTVPLAGHLAPMENPEPVNAAIRSFMTES